MKSLRFIVWTAALTLLCSTGALAAEFPNAAALYQHWHSIQTDHTLSPYPDYICGVWSTDGGTENLTFAVTNDDAGEAGKAEILELIEDDSTAQFAYQTYSHAELFAIQWELTDSLGDETGAWGIGVSEMDNVVSIGIDMEHPGSDVFMKECYGKYGDRIRFEDGSGVTVAFTEEIGGVGPGSMASSATGHQRSSFWLWTPVALLLLFAVWMRRQRQAAVQTGSGTIATASAGFSRKNTVEAIRDSEIPPPPETCQAILREINENKETTT